MTREPLRVVGDLRDGLLDAYQRACGLRVELDMLPRWRWLRRQHLTAELAATCGLADLMREAIAGHPCDPPLELLLDEHAPAL